MTIILPLSKAPSGGQFLDTNSRITFAWRKFLEEITEFHKFVEWEPTLTVEGGGTLSSSDVYAAYFGRRNMFYELYLHLSFQISGTVNKLVVSTPSYLDYTERYGGATALVDSASDTFEAANWYGRNTPALVIERPGANFTAGVTRYVQIQKIFMQDM